MPDKDRKKGAEEILWAEVLTRAGMRPEDQRPFINLARGRDMEIQRLQRGQQSMKESIDGQKASLDRLGDLIEEAIKLDKEE